MSSPRSSSDAFSRLHPDIQRWVWDEGWDQLRNAQEQAVEPIMGEKNDVIISAATAAGKTEAAFLPICSRLAEEPGPAGVSVLYLSPLKALINDQNTRLEEICGRVDIKVNRWHGDVSGSAKAKLLRKPEGVLLITPESLEALLARRGTTIPGLFAGLRYIVIDELHAFFGNERGHQLQSLVHRVELAVRRRVPRIALSATLSDLAYASEFLRPENPADVVTITSDDDAQELKLQLLGFSHVIKPGEGADPSAASQDVAEHLMRRLGGSHNLIFANSRQKVEALADALNALSVEWNVPAQFLPHHGNLSKDVREDVERRLNDETRPATAVCTSTLELGIDIGSMESVAQVGTPPSVASLRQRLGRAGRRGDAAVLRMYITEPPIDARTALVDTLRADIVQSIASVNLLLARWYEPSPVGLLDYSTLIQQILSVIAQHGGVSAADAHRVLCGPGPFGDVTPDRFVMLLRDMGKADLITQMDDGTLLGGVVGERIVNHYEFYTAFVTPQEYRLVAGDRTLGTLPISVPLYPGALMIFAGRRWSVQDVDQKQRVIELQQASGGVPPDFGGDGSPVNVQVHEEMKRIYQTTDVPPYLDATAKQLLTEGRDNFRRHNLSKESIVERGNESVLFHWSGDQVSTTLICALSQLDVRATTESFALNVAMTSREQLIDALQTLASWPVPDPEMLAAGVKTKEASKYDWALGPNLLDEAYASRSLDVPKTWAWLTQAIGTIA